MNIISAKRIVVKIGSALIVDQQDNTLRSQWLAGIAHDISDLKAQGKEIVIVTSGAVGLGKKYLTPSVHPLKLEEKQAAAACGQIELMADYQQHFRRHGARVAQVLLTIEDSEDRRRYLNARSTLETLLGQGIIPIINENDTVATAELRFGDNDRLAARVAQMVSADLLVLLSDIDGLYTANPKLDPTASHIPEVHEITKEIEAMAGGAVSSVGTGGMATKIAAAQIAVQSGCHMLIGLGNLDRPLTALIHGARSTVFIPHATPYSARKHWLASTLHTKGVLIIDGGAQKALQGGKSLLPAGVVEVQGKFKRGDAVMIKNMEGITLGRGLTAYSSTDAKRIIGRKSHEIEQILGFSGRDELIHRYDLVMMEG